MEGLKNILIIIIVFGGLAVVLATNSEIRDFFKSVFRYESNEPEYQEDVLMFLDSRNMVFKSRFHSQSKVNVLDIAPVPGNQTLLYAATTDGIYLSVDGGGNWRKANIAKELEEDAMIYRIYPDPQKPFELSFLVSKGGKVALYKTSDGFLTVQKLFEMETEVFGNVAPGRNISTMIPSGGKIFIGTSEQ